MSTGAKDALAERYRALVQRLRTAEDNFGKASGSVQPVAVSKTYPTEDVRAVAALGQQHFGENQLQDAMQKIPHLVDNGALSLREVISRIKINLLGRWEFTWEYWVRIRPQAFALLTPERIGQF